MKSKIFLIIVAPILFFAGFFSGQQNDIINKEEGKILGLNHVGLRVANFDKALDFYQNDLGFPMIYKFDNKEGNPIFAYVQINKTTFIELLPADEEHPEGIDHFGLETRNNEAVVKDFHSLGMECTASTVSPFTHVNIAHAIDPNGIYFEIIEAIEGSDLKRVMDNWKE
ncbi:VOC family protein [Winogradskyella alexanderae]|uniref:VOC family protein n=1 Tax=Winogradskyella alexanderae TaxID=2877123 RepID=A0ABS7XV15_9FLAO|nr:VOC family protein [Winogradskyella alexanderae]MCA0133861.1 VOC family protein [Winogradskyella alexanderae]